jgi:hypothetical protein
VNWYDNPVDDMETSLTGVSYFPGSEPVVYPSPSVNFIVASGGSSDLLLRGTGLGDYSEFGTYNDGSDTVVGPETDRRQASTPNNFKLLASAYLGGFESASLGYFATSNTSRTITTATMNWTLGLSQDYTHWNAVDQISLNILNDSALGADLAYGATATASSVYSSEGYSVASINDGSRSTVYSSEPTTLSSNAAWVEIAMASSTSISKVVLYPRNDAPYVGFGFPIAFQIQIWDGAEWLTRVSVSSAPSPGSQRQVYTWGSSDTTSAVRVYATTLGSIGSFQYALQLAQISIHA